MFLGTVQAQSSDSTEYNRHEYHYTKDLYRQEKNRLLWSVFGSTCLAIGNGINYYRNGEKTSLTISGLSLTYNMYSVGRLIYLKREIKKIENGESDY